MKRLELLESLIDILKDIDGSDIQSDRAYYEDQAERIIRLCGHYYDYCELMEN